MKEGTIIRGYLLGKKMNKEFIWKKCSICKQNRWVRLAHMKKANYTGMCKNCFDKSRVGENHFMWRGGIIITRFGYRMVKATGHPLSDNRGYIMEHRLVAADKWGTVAVKDMVVHHIDGDRLNNNIENLELMERGVHSSGHLRTEKTKRIPLNGENPIISCKCGCGETFTKYNKWGQKRRYVLYHGRRQDVPL